ncbi:MAG: T9SS type A sorting domain-containing protein [Cruoricaptor ignavus]|nr:T9SS type A sorting domain-containing protein [Cruoricaptor ignavus]
MNIHQLRIVLSAFIFLLCSSQWIYGQSKIYPAGVPEPIIWLSRATENDGTIKEMISEKSLDDMFILNEYINEHRSFKFIDSKVNSFIKPLSNADVYSLFIVYKDTTHNEQQLWSLQSSEKPVVVGTTHRLADLSQTQYRSFSEKFLNQKVKIHYYQHYKRLSKKHEMSSYHIQIGGQKSSLPPEFFTGDFAEIIIYNRILSPLEAQQVSSYLAIKYGISLHQSEFKNYYNSIGTKIWDYDANKSFNQNITAIGRDNFGYLFQSKSQNSNDEGIFSFFFQNPNNIADQSFVFWSDNGQGLAIKKQKEGQPQGISRQWKIQSTDDGNSFKSSLLSAIVTPSSIEGIKEKDNLWLVIDESGTGEFRPRQTRYANIGNEAFPTIENWELSGLQPAIFTIWQAPPMFAHLDIQSPRCLSSTLGKVTFRIIGGQSPYQISLFNIDKNQIQEQWTEFHRQGEKSLSLSSGQYRYQVTDAQDQTYTQNLYISDTDAPKPKLNTEYWIKNPQHLNLSEHLPKGNYTYEWYLNENLISQKPEFLLSQSGDYEVRIKNADGCHSAHYFKAFSGAENLDSKIMIYPNPSKDGHFKIHAEFPKPTSGTITLYTIVGQFLTSKAFYNEDQYEYHGFLPTQGVYIIKIKTDLGEVSKRLIVE